MASTRLAAEVEQGIEVECLACAGRRIVPVMSFRALGVCACGYAGWAPSAGLSDSMRLWLRSNPVDRAGLSAPACAGPEAGRST